MHLTKVTDRKTRQLFLDIARIIYKNDRTWVCPLDNEINAIFEPDKNAYFKHGELERWILLDNGKPIGRIAAFIDYKIANSYEQPTGGIGYFECIDDQNAASLLFDNARNWLKEKGMEAMDGPINFGETDKYWGLLVDGFTHPSFEVPYNPPYYKKLFEDYGFCIFYKMEGFHIDITKPMGERHINIARWITNRPGYEFRHFTWKEQDKYATDFAEVYNKAWATFKTFFEPIEPEYIKQTLQKARPIIDEEFIWYAYFEGKPIAIYVMFPDINQVLKHLNGRMNIINMLKFIYYKKLKTITRAKGLIMGVIPQFQNRGIESAFMLFGRQALEKKPQYTEVELSWVADINPKMRKTFIAVGGVPAKDYITYRYLFDRKKEFKRYPIPEIKN
jgi:hypothetical protein